MRLRQETKSGRSRDAILEAALDLFAIQGYRGTSIREIADGAGLSTGNLYHHFPDKEAVFAAAMERHVEAITRPGSPVHEALAAGAFPDDLAALARAARVTIRAHGRRMNLVYVDAVEFGGSHLNACYGRLAERLGALGEAPGAAVLLACRAALHYHMIETLFGIPAPGNLVPDLASSELTA